MLTYGRLIVELHGIKCHRINGTLLKKIGATGTAIVHVRHAEEAIQAELDEPWQRAYLRAGEGVLAVWTRGRTRRSVKCLLRNSAYDGVWRLPFHGHSTARAAVGVWGMDVSNRDAELAWVTSALDRSATAILFNAGEIRSAWERVDGRPEMIARGPRGIC